MADLLKARGLCKSRDGFELKDVDLTVPEGGVVGFIGANGAGKTTTIQAVLGLIGRDGGSVELFGNRMDGASEGVEVAVKNRIGVVFDSCSFPDTVNVAEAGCCMAAVYGQWDADGFASLCASFELPEKRKIKELSRGMGMKLMLAVALSHGADLLLLDEATAGLDPMARDELLDILRGFMETEGRGILMSSHITSDLERIADYIVCIDEGQVVFACKKDDITESAGIARCRADQLDEVAASGLFEAGELYYSQHKYGVDVLAGDRAAFAGRFPEMVLDRMTIDDYMALRLKGSVR